MIDPASLGSLVVLALVDSGSFGTLLIPIWLLAAPGRLRIGRLLVYLGTVTTAYFALGVVLLLGASALANAYRDLIVSDGFLLAQLALGAALLIVSQLMDTKKARARAAERAATGGGRLLGWRGRIMNDEPRAGSSAALVGLALTAVAIEAASMLPYLAGIGIITAKGPGWPGSIVILIGYCVVMISPALVLLVLRLVAASALETRLRKMDSWLTRHAQATTAWVIGIVGFLLAARAIYDLGWFGIGT
jgi:hypothetical protein